MVNFKHQKYILKTKLNKQNFYVGMWCELPIMVHQLPEGWRLPSILTILTQASQIGPIVFLVLKWKYPKRISFVVTIYIILSVGALSCLLLVFFWDKTAVIGSEKRSIGLYILTFSLGLLGNFYLQKGC
jgi:riboflavin transporter 2